MKNRYFVAFAIALGGCVAGAGTPVVSDYNGASVKLQTSSWESAETTKAKTQAEATRICAKTGKRAEYASTTTNPNTYISEHLYLCL